MNHAKYGLPVESTELLNLGVALGHNSALGLIAGRCSAAQAKVLLDLRESKTHLKFTPTWKEFCPRYLNVSSAYVDRIIRIYERFGPRYFEVAQMTRISPETYAAIEPSIQEGCLNWDGEEIELDPENAERVASAVAEMRKALPPKEPPKPPELPERIKLLAKHCDDVMREYREILKQGPIGKQWEDCLAELVRMTEEFHL